MTNDAEVRPLTQGDDRSGFSCGQADLDRFFHHYAAQNQFKLRLSVTYVVVVRHEILAFVTVTAGSLERASLPSDRMKKRLPNYPLPVLRIARLGVDLRAQRLGLGKALLRHVFGLALDQRDHSGCVGVVSDAKPDAVAFYQRLGFELIEGVREGLLVSEPQPMFLGIETIAAAKGR